MTAQMVCLVLVVSLHVLYVFGQRPPQAQGGPPPGSGPDDASNQQPPQPNPRQPRPDPGSQPTSNGQPDIGPGGSRGPQANGLSPLQPGVGGPQDNGNGQGQLTAGNFGQARPTVDDGSLDGGVPPGASPPFPGQPPSVRGLPPVQGQGAGPDGDPTNRQGPQLANFIQPQLAGQPPLGGPIGGQNAPNQASPFNRPGFGPPGDANGPPGGGFQQGPAIGQQPPPQQGQQGSLPDPAGNGTTVDGKRGLQATIIGRNNAKK